MKKSIFVIILSAICLSVAIGITACESKCKDIELMGAGDRIHDSFTFANVGVVLTDKGENNFEISGSVEYLSDEKVKKEFSIAEDIHHVVAIKLSNCSSTSVDSSQVEISVNGNRNYDAEHLNGSNYTFIILEAKPNSTTTISVKWNKDAEPKEYSIFMSQDLELLNKE